METRSSAILLASHFPGDEEVTGRLDGWVTTLGTLASHRKRGIASAMVLTACHAFRDAGFNHALLGVDSESPTGAYRLYQQLGFTELNRSVQHQLEVRKRCEWWVVGGASRSERENETGDIGWRVRRVGGSGLGASQVHRDQYPETKKPPDPIGPGGFPLDGSSTQASERVQASGVVSEWMVSRSDAQPVPELTTHHPSPTTLVS